MDSQFSNNAPFVDTSSTSQHSGFNHSPRMDGRYNQMQQIPNGGQQQVRNLEKLTDLMIHYQFFSNGKQPHAFIANASAFLPLSSRKCKNEQLSKHPLQIPPNANTNNYMMQNQQRPTNACNPNPTASDDFYSRQQPSNFYYQNQQQQPPWRKASLACNFRL
jgi:hypothetical protein